MTTAKRLRLSVRPAEGMGRGVFAQTAIRKGEIIETCPVIPLSESEEKKLSGTVLDHYLFAWGQKQERSCIALGFGSLYNHSAAPNAAACWVEGRDRIDFVALHEIEAGEQILIDYEWEESEYHFPPGERAPGRIPSRPST